MHVRQLFFGRIITILFSGVCTLFLTISAIVPSRGSTFFSQASGCGEQEVGVASGSGWNLWVWLLGVVLRRYIDFLILLIPTPLVSVLFCSSIPTFLFIL